MDGSPLSDGSGTSGGDGKRQKTSHSVGGFGPAKGTMEIGSRRARTCNDGPSPPAATNASLKSEATGTTKEMPELNIHMKRIAELKEIFSTPEAKEAMKPTAIGEPLYDSDDIEDEEWYWEDEQYDPDDPFPRTTDESLRSNEKYYQAMKYAVDKSGMSRGLYTTEERAREYRDVVRVVVKSKDPKRSEIVDLLLSANVGFQKSRQDEEPLALNAAKLWCTDTSEDFLDLLRALKRNAVSFDEKNAEDACANDVLPRCLRAVI